MTTMSDDCKRRIRAIELGLKPSGVDMRGGAIAALASQAGHHLDQWLAATFNHNFDAYDRAIDAVYNSTRIGGSHLHHLLDGQHSILGAFAAVKDVSADDSFLRELAEAGEHLLRDTASVSGTNVLLSLTPEQYAKIAKAAANVGITKSYLADAMMVNGSELLGGLLGLVSSIAVARRGSPESLSRLGGALALSSLASANPALMAVAGGATAYALYKSGQKSHAVVQAGKGAVVSGSCILVTNLLGGPIWWGCVLSIGTAVMVGKALDNPRKAFARVKALIKPACNVISLAVERLRQLPAYEG